MKVSVKSSHKARSNGIAVRDVDPATEANAFDKFYEVMREVSQRTALPLRSAVRVETFDLT